MEIKPGSGSLIDVVSRWDSQGTLAVGDQIGVRILSVKGDLVVISLYGQEVLVRTELPFEPGMVVNLRYEGINDQGQHTFRLVDRQTGTPAQTVRLAHEVLRQFGLEPSPELVSRLGSYLRLGQAGRGKPAAYGEDAPLGSGKPEQGAEPGNTRETGRRAELIRQSAEQFALLAKAGVPLTNTNLRIWRQFWEEPVLAEALPEITAAADDGGEIADGLKQLIHNLFVMMDSADSQNLKLQLAKWLKPKAAGQPVSEGETDPFEAGKTEKSAVLRKLETALVRVAEQYGALKAVNAAGRRFCPEHQPLFFVFPVAYDGSAFAVEMLVEDQEKKQGKRRDEQQAVRITLAIPTRSLGRVVAVITMQGDRLSLELASDLPETVDLMEKHLDRSGLKEIFQFIRVRLQNLDRLEPKNRLLVLFKQQISPQIDLRI